MNFAVIGVGGYIAPRHLRAIKETGHRIVAAVDPHDAVGFLDDYDLDVAFFTEIERFERHLDKLRRTSPEQRVHWVTICSPNYLHDAHCRLAIRQDADVLCEKPLVINPWNLDALEELERESGRTINTVLQLRLHPELLRWREKLARQNRVADVRLTYVTVRGAWYRYSWKSDPAKSGGVAVNIGIHFFDLLLWMFGQAHRVKVHLSEPQRMAGTLELQRAHVQWFLSTEPKDLPASVAQSGRRTYRSLRVGDETIEFSDGFSQLHTKVYAEALAGRGVRIPDVRPSVELVHRLRTTAISSPTAEAHPCVLSSEREL
jgi:UDP-N-acetyl-2-amino-2-deoxyglucuronate dehydrogenase